MKLYTNGSQFFFNQRPIGVDSTYVGNDDSSNYVNLMAAQQANQQNLQIAQMNNDFNQMMWEKNNEYNSPANQVQRLIDAGINPSSQMGNYQNTSQGQVQGIAPNMQAGQIDPNAKVNKWSSAVNAFTSAMEAVKGALTSGLDVKRLGNEIRGLDISQQLADNQTPLFKAQARLFGSKAFSQEFQNTKAEETYKNAQDNIKASTQNLLSNSSLSDEKKSLLSKNIEWVDRLNSAQLAQVASSVRKMDAETHGQWSRNQVDELYARLAQHGIDPHAHGLDKFLDVLIDQPDEIKKIFETIYGGESKGVDTSTPKEHTNYSLKPVDKFVDRMLQSIPLPFSNLRHSNVFQTQFPLSYDWQKSSRW